LASRAGASRAQPARPVIGVLDTTGADSYWTALKLASFRKGLAEAGGGADVQLEIASAEGRYDRLPALAQQLVKRQVAVILASGLPAALAARDATSTIPIVFVSGADPVAQGLVRALNRPGGNLTGTAQLFGVLGAKRFDLLAQLVPQGTIGLLSNPANPNAEAHLADLRAAAAKLARPVEVYRASTPEALDAAHATMAANGVKAILVADDPMFTQERSRLIGLAAMHRLPAMYYTREFTDAGGLVSYGSNARENFRLAGTYAARILKGESPSGLPVLQPTTFELVFNMRTARSIGLTPPPALLAVADEVID
jgi:putative ABC transport system substrate-binding protein